LDRQDFAWQHLGDIGVFCIWVCLLSSDSSFRRKISINGPDIYGAIELIILS
jgi:hypothetical protein